MLVSAILLSFFSFVAGNPLWPWPWPWRGIPHVPFSLSINLTVYHDLVRYTKYSSAVYQKICPKPLGNALVAQFAEVLMNVNGFVVRDDKRKEIVVVFRGTDAAGLVDWFTDSRVLLSQYHSPGISNETYSSDTAVHTGFLGAYNSVADMVVGIVSDEVERYPDYTIICAGHSLGGSLASLAAVSLRHNIPQVEDVKLFTFGQPRTGNFEYAQFVEQSIGASNTFRVVHMYDGVPTMIPQYTGYHHHATEFWQISEPANPDSVRECTRTGEDPGCSRSIRSTGINSDHWTYLDHVMTMEPWLCV